MHSATATACSGCLLHCTHFCLASLGGKCTCLPWEEHLGPACTCSSANTCWFPGVHLPGCHPLGACLSGSLPPSFILFSHTLLPALSAGCTTASFLLPLDSLGPHLPHSPLSAPGLHCSAPAFSLEVGSHHLVLGWVTPADFLLPAVRLLPS